VLFTTYRFNWTEWQNGLSLALVGIMFAIVSGGLTGKVVGKLGERRALIFGLCVSATGYLLYGLATQGWMLYAIIAATSIGGVAGAALMALITKLVPANEQGALQGALGSVQSVAAIIGPLMATSLFGYFTSPRALVHLPGAAFLASSLLVVIAVLLAVRSASATPMTKAEKELASA
jgi:DHA1 family tetracycline resistance protein-like MFS transporter